MVYAGIDVAKDKHEALVLDSDGVILAGPFSFNNDRQGFSAFLSTLCSVFFVIVHCTTSAFNCQECAVLSCYISVFYFFVSPYFEFIFRSKNKLYLNIEQFHSHSDRLKNNVFLSHQNPHSKYTFLIRLC